ncbi:MAG: response regulator [Tissierella sp.]|nr:response regulator [Tissierella sp.]
MIRVLIVEDDPMVAKINRNYIESVDGFIIVSIATNYIEAINILKNNNIDLVLLDVYLPKGDGISILKEIRKKQLKCDVIMVTASAEIQKIDSALRLGVFDY